ncbi:MAG: D-tyrosyl-tRNA(Tyr) deacylase [Candidatus Tectomicrobia bacterium]|nr:D-tyrosyl-tRNA(Tyr) deacylase [Candidatus Tectomicrobia bacterium]
MRAVVQRVSQARVSIQGRVAGEIGRGLLVLLGIGKEDDSTDVEYMTSKVVNLRIFEDHEGKMNLSLKDVKGEMLVVSQFTLYGDCRKGRRPSFIDAAEPEQALLLYERFLAETRNLGIQVASGEFQAMMDVFLVNQGPVTILLDSKKAF